jgi:hypothetical protein
MPAAEAEERLPVAEMAPATIQNAKRHTGTVDLDGFWTLTDAAKTPADLHARLARLSDADLQDYERFHDELMRRAYRWDLWGAAYVIDGGCSDDGFAYFRSYLISRGRAVYDAALADADGLAALTFEDADGWEDWMSPTMMVIHARTGKYAFARPPDVNREPLGDPAGEEWDEDDLEARFPRLTERYG